MFQPADAVRRHFAVMVGALNARQPSDAAWAVLAWLLRMYAVRPALAPVAGGLLLWPMVAANGAHDLTITKTTTRDLGEDIASHRMTADVKLDVLGGMIDDVLLEGAIVLEVDLFLAGLDLVEWRLRDIEVATLDDVGEVPEEECQQQGADVRTVDVGVGHHDDPMVAESAGVELIADRGPERRDQRSDLVVLQHLVEPRLLDVQNLAAQRQDGLEAAVAALLRRTTRRVTLDDVELGPARVALGAVGQLARQVEPA